MNRDTGTDITAESRNILRHLNGRHPDTVLFLARHAAGITDAVEAELVTANSDGVDIAVKRARGSSTCRLQFTEAIASMSELRLQIRGLMIAARAAAPQEPLTSLEEEMASRTPGHHAAAPD